MPPRQGQSQFISPVSSLKAPSWEASSSVSSSCPASTAAVVVWADEWESMGKLEGEGLDWREADMDSRVGRAESSAWAEGDGIESVGCKYR